MNAAVNLDGCFVLVTPERAPLTIFNWRAPKPPAPGYVPTFTSLANAKAFLLSIPYSNLPAPRDLTIAVFTARDVIEAPTWMKFTVDPPPFPALPKRTN